MKKFQIKPAIYEFERFSEFAAEFNISENDLVFTHKFIYEPFMKDLGLKCSFLFQEDFGTGEPSDKMVDKILEYLKDIPFKRLIGVGGGTVIDISKLLVVKDAASTLDMFDEKIPLIRDRGLVLVPTTCGTGSEMTCVSVIDITARNTKMGKRIEQNFADAAVLIPELVEGLPYEFFLYSSVDSLIHALEIYVCSKTTSYDEIFCIEATRMIIEGYKKIIQEGPEARFPLIGQFLAASNYAGIALANVVCGAVHAMAMHFGSAHHVPHGESNYRFLTSVFNTYAREEPTGKITKIAQVINETLGTTGGTEEAFKALEELLKKVIPPKKLSEYGMKTEDIEKYADKVIETQQRLLVNSYIPMTREHLINIYKELI